MRILNRLSVVSIAAAIFLSRPLVSAPPKVPSYQQFLSPASPQELVAARKADRFAWVDYAEGKRNAYTAAAPLFTPVRLTNFLKDDGIMMSGIKISDDGSTVVFMRGEAPNREGWSPNPSADPNGPEHAIWAARTSGVGGAWRVVDATNPELAPDGSSILFVKSGTDLSRESHAGEAGERGGSRREGVHHRVGRAERAEVVARRPQDRVRQHAHGSQLHRGVRRGDAIGEVHVAERGLRHDADVAARQQAPDVHAAAGPAVWAAGATRRGRNRSADRTGRAAARGGARTRRARRRRGGGALRGGRRAAPRPGIKAEGQGAAAPRRSSTTLRA